MYMRAALLALALGQASALLSSPPSDDKHASALTSPPNDEEANYDKFAVLRAPPNEDKVAVLRALDDAQVMAEVARRNLNACDDAPQEHRALTEVFYSFNYQCECDPTASPTPSPTTCPPKTLDVCIIVDESGSICSSTDDPALCIPKEPNSCDADRCDGVSDKCDFEGGCPRFNDIPTNEQPNIKNFVTTFIDAVEKDLGELVGTKVTAQYSVVEFSTTATETSQLVDADDAKAAVNGIVYSGGYTNLQQAIVKCAGTLSPDADDPQKKSLIVVLSDGVPNRKDDPATPGETEAKDAAKNAANDAKADGIDIATVYVLGGPSDGRDFLETEIASSSDLATEDQSFPKAEVLAGKILEGIDECDTPAPTQESHTTSSTTMMVTPAPTTPEPSPSPTLSPTVCDYTRIEFKEAGKNYNECKAVCQGEGMQIPCIYSKEVDDALGEAIEGEEGVEAGWTALKRYWYNKDQGKSKWHYDDHCKPEIGGYMYCNSHGCQNKWKDGELFPYGKNAWAKETGSPGEEPNLSGSHVRKSTASGEYKKDGYWKKKTHGGWKWINPEWVHWDHDGKWADTNGDCKDYGCFCQPICH